MSKSTATETVDKLRIMDPTLKIRSDPVVVKLDSPQFKSIFTRNLKALVELFGKYNYEIRVAGGAVRWVENIVRPHVHKLDMEWRLDSVVKASVVH